MGTGSDRRVRTIGPPGLAINFDVDSHHSEGIGVIGSDQKLGIGGSPGRETNVDIDLRDRVSFKGSTFLNMLALHSSLLYRLHPLELAGRGRHKTEIGSVWTPIIATP